MEVAEASAVYDREVKVPLYARAGIPEVWLVDLAGARIEVYRHPSPEGYREVRTAGRGDRVTSGAVSSLELAVDDSLG